MEVIINEAHSDNNQSTIYENDGPIGARFVFNVNAIAKELSANPSSMNLPEGQENVDTPMTLQFTLHLEHLDDNFPEVMPIELRHDGQLLKRETVSMNANEDVNLLWSVG